MQGLTSYAQLLKKKCGIRGKREGKKAVRVRQVLVGRDWCVTYKLALKSAWDKDSLPCVHNIVVQPLI